LINDSTGEKLFLFDFDTFLNFVFHHQNTKKIQLLLYLFLSFSIKTKINLISTLFKQRNNLSSWNWIN